MRKLLCLAVIAGVLFVAVSVFKGGSPFRRFGSRVEEESVKAGQKADSIKKTVTQVREKARHSMNKVHSIANAITGDKDRK